MSGWWLVGPVVVALVLLAGLACAVVDGRSQRRGGLLELDTWEARNALKLGHPDAGLSELRGHPYEQPPDPPLDVSKLRRCNPERGVHFHGAGDWCECGQVPNVRTIRPFAGGGE